MHFARTLKVYARSSRAFGASKEGTRTRARATFRRRRSRGDAVVRVAVARETRSGGGGVRATRRVQSFDNEMC
jgi:hypothetical protein